MACDGYEHDSRVVLIADLLSYNIPKGEEGTVVNVDRIFHKIDVLFAQYGRIDNLDPHSFELEEGKPLTAGA